MALQADYEGFSAMALGGAEKPGDDRLLVKFFYKSKENPTKSAEAGRPIFEDREYISIMVPGQKDSIVIRPVSDLEKRRFPRHYQAFIMKQDEVVEGTPLEDWPGITRSQVEELKYFNISTVEQLAEVSDSNAQKFMGIQMLKKRAALYIEAAKDNAVTEKLAAELQERDDRISSLEATIQDMSQNIKELREGDSVPDSGGDSKPSRRRSRADASS